MKSNKSFRQNSFSKSPSSSERNRRGTESVDRVPSNFPRPALQVGGDEQFQKIYSLDVNLTIRLKIQEFTRKQATVLAGQALYLVAEEGITLQDWMILEFLYSYLLGQKQDYTQIKDFKEFEIILILKIVLLSGTWIGLEGKSMLPEDVLFLIRNSRWVPNKRTFFSRKELFRLNRFLEVRIVPVDALLERSKGNVRYSSYCKGYGEGSSMARPQRTRPSAELDGEQVDIEKETLINVPLLEIGRILDQVLLEIKYTNRKRK